MSRSSMLAAGLLALMALPASAQIAPGEYAARRDSLAARMGDGAVIAFGARSPVGANGAFQQLPAFDYLTGFREPDAALVLVNHGGALQPTLFTETPTVREQMYMGFREDPRELARRTGFGVRPIGDLGAYADSLVDAGLPIFELRDFATGDAARRDTLTRGRAFVDALVVRRPGLEVRDLHRVVNALRARKSPAELALIRRAIAITDSAHLATLDAVRPGVWEYQVQATIDHAFRSRGADGPAFSTIVGSGPNSTTLHYASNTRQMRAGDVVVMDIGAQFDGYAADITRTLPVSGRFSPEQRAIYDLVRAAEDTAARVFGPGATAAAATEASQAVRLEGMARLGLIQSPDATYDPPWPVNCDARPDQCLQGMLFMIHGISHGIGLEVHDRAHADTRPGTYAVGDVVTNEPGIYINARVLALLPDTPKNRAFLAAVRKTVERYDGIGIRVEDDYLITPDGSERLSFAPRDADEIEALMTRAHHASRGYRR